MEVAVGQEDKPALLGVGVLARLLLAHKRVLVLRLRFQHQHRKALAVQKQEIHKPFFGLFKVLTECIKFR